MATDLTLRNERGARSVTTETEAARPDASLADASLADASLVSRVTALEGEVERTRAELRAALRLVHDLKQQVERDPDTGMLTRAAFLQEMSLACVEARRPRHPLAGALIYLQISDFGAIRL